MLRNHCILLGNDDIDVEGIDVILTFMCVCVLQTDIFVLTMKMMSEQNEKGIIHL